VLLLLLFAAVIKIPLLNTPRLPIRSSSDGALYRELLSFLQGTGIATPLFYSTLAFLLLLGQALLLNFFFSQQKMLNHSTDLPGMAYLLLTSLFPQWSYFSAPLLMNGSFSICCFCYSGYITVAKYAPRFLTWDS